MREQSLNERIAGARSKKLHTAAMRDLIEHFIEVRDVASAAHVPMAIVADLPANVYDALKEAVECRDGRIVREPSIDEFASIYGRRRSNK